jgi:hypothetical protein
MQVCCFPPKTQVCWHNVDRVTGFLSSRPNWDYITPSPTGECGVPPSFGSGWGGGGWANALGCGRGGGGGGGVSIPTRDKQSSTLGPRYIFILGVLVNLRRVEKLAKIT